MPDGEQRHTSGAFSYDHARYRRAVEEARAVLDRLDRIERLERAGAPPRVLLAELHALVGEAERWARRENPAALAIVERCRAALAVDQVA